MRRSSMFGAGLVAMALGATALLVACANDDSATNDDSDAASSLPSSVGDAGGDAASSCDGCSDAGDAGESWPFSMVTVPLDPRFNLFGVWGSSKDDIWAVGVGGTAVHYGGSAWTVSQTGVTQALNSVWGSAGDDVWAFSNAGLIVRWSKEGSADPAWHIQPSIDADSPWVALSAWGFGKESLYVVGTGMTLDPESGDSRNVMAYGQREADGSLNWTKPLGCRYCSEAYGVWGAAANDVWLVGAGGQAQHSQHVTGVDAGRLAWTPVQTYTNRALRAVWGSSSNDVWAVGAGGTIRHWTNDASQRWTVVESGVSEDLNAVWGTGPNDVWAVGNAATILHFDGTSWTHRPSGLQSPHGTAALFGIWGSAADDIWIVGAGVVLHSKGGDVR